MSPFSSLNARSTSAIPPAQHARTSTPRVVGLLTDFVARKDPEKVTVDADPSTPFGISFANGGLVQKVWCTHCGGPERATIGFSNQPRAVVVAYV